MYPLSHSQPLLVGRTAAAFLFLLLAFAVAVEAQEPTFAAPQGGEKKDLLPKSTVKGRVVYEDSERPVRRSPVSLLQPNNGPQNQETATDRNGKFVLKNVPAGRYFVMVSSPGIITPLAFLKIGEDKPERCRIERY